MADFHPMDKSILSHCRVDLSDAAVKEDYHKYRQAYAWMGQVGQLPFANLCELVRNHGDFQPTEQPDLKLVAEEEASAPPPSQPKKTAKKATAKA